MAKKPPRVRRTFTPQFKKDAVALVDGGRSVNAVAHDLGIARSLLQRWRTQLRREPEAAFPGTGRLAPQAEQVRHGQAGQAEKTGLQGGAARHALAVASAAVVMELKHRWDPQQGGVGGGYHAGKSIAPERKMQMQTRHRLAGVPANWLRPWQDRP